MKPWAIDAAGIVRAADGRSVAVLEPEQAPYKMAALAVAPRLVGLASLLERAEEARRDADASSPAKRKVAEDAAGGAMAAVWAELRQIQADLLEARDRLHAVPTSLEACDCREGCGEVHLGGHCRAVGGQSIRRQTSHPGVWMSLASGSGWGPVVVTRVYVTVAGPRCERCAWLTARREGRATS